MENFNTNIHNISSPQNSKSQLGDIVNTYNVSVIDNKIDKLQKELAAVIEELTIIKAKLSKENA